jgi:NAD(P)H-dependent flavin oxidoreductase YrpB (nitropropane dioxygenase family)
VTVSGITALLEQTHALTTNPFGVNFLVAPPDLEAMEPDCFAVAARSARLVEFFYGWPDRELVDIVHAQGALACWQVGSQAEAVAAAAAGCDLLVAQGLEAGGHIRGTIGLLALLDDVLATVDIPVLAAGGIGSGRAMAAALAAGADGVRVGTRFVAAAEANAHPLWVEQLIAARAEDTVYTEAFSVGWENAPHRVLRSAVAAAEAFPGDIVGDVPALEGTRIPLARFQPDAISREASGEIAAMSLWAGESVGGVRQVQPAAEIVAEMTAQAEHLLRRWRGDDASNRD